MTQAHHQSVVSVSCKRNYLIIVLLLALARIAFFLTYSLVSLSFRLHRLFYAKAASDGHRDQESDGDKPEVDGHEVASVELISVRSVSVVFLSSPVTVAHIGGALELLASDNASTV